MLENGVNAIFISKRNTNLGYNIKKLCWQRNINVYNVENYFEIYSAVKSLNNLLVIIDCLTVNVNSALIKSLRECINSKFLNILLVVSKDNYENNNKIISSNSCCYYLLTNENLFNDFIFIEKQLTINFVNNLNLNFEKINNYLNSILINSGFATKHLGFSIIKECVCEIVKNNNAILSLNKNIYPIIAKNRNMHISTIERNIRNAISRAILTKKFAENELNMLVIDNNLSNKVLIAYLVDKVMAYIKI